VIATRRTEPRLRAILCDADGCLFPSEGPAYDASVDVVNALLDELGVHRRYTAHELRSDYTGRNFRATVPRLCAENGVDLTSETLERWTAIEADEVTSHLASVLPEDPEVSAAVQLLAAAFPFAVVSSSASKRVDACLSATGLSQFVQDGRLFSAEDSLPRPISKPDPAIYQLAGNAMGVTGSQALAIEDSEVGVRAAVAAGFPVVGLLHFAPADEADQLAARLREAGATRIATTWADLLAQLTG
jgi:beta-phosphoglucomutase-like phosphatase (HAD superfamily)